MNGLEVGRLERATTSRLHFTYAPDWLDAELATPVSLSMPLSPEAYTGDVVENFFDNLLPDSADIRQRMREHLGAESQHPFDLLAAAGADCAGALQLFESDDMPDVHQVKATRISDAEVASALRDYRRRPLGMTADSDQFRISIAGAQEKTAYLWYQDAWHRPEGPTPTSHIFKLPIGRLEPYGIDLSQSVELEWLSMHLAASFGLRVAHTEIAEFEGVRVLVVERFDRRWSDDGSWLIRLPQEDFCQALAVAPAHKYENEGGPGIRAGLDLLLQSQEPDIDRKEFFLAQIVFWLLAASDGHAKNFSMYLRPEGRMRLAPLYDVMSVYPIVANNDLARQEVRLAMAVLGKNRHYRWDGIEGRHFLSTAKLGRFPEQEARMLLAECAARVEPAIAMVEAELPKGFPEAVAEAVFAGVRDTARKIGLAG